LCKPDLKQQPVGDFAENFWHWKRAITRLAACERVYMKLSGCFSEMQSQNSDQGGKSISVMEVVELIRPWVSHIFSAFGASRIMFGSDWPVCNVGGPGDEKSWTHWREVVEALLNDLNISADDRDRVWFGTAVEAYRLDSLEN
jgi:L-rhamnono-1,4-lactonase